jgi:hypothetical protein
MTAPALRSRERLLAFFAQRLRFARATPAPQACAVAVEEDARAGRQP